MNISQLRRALAECEQAKSRGEKECIIKLGGYNHAVYLIEHLSELEPKKEKPTFWVPTHIIQEVAEFNCYFQEKCKRHTSWRNVRPLKDLREFRLGMFYAGGAEKEEIDAPEK